ncbi:hypothetical protein LIER_20587 [Lithospermum erythrorhizon]|uniref:F-box domain-containing protein n=1 Tax=Lithospermum erythrorhizon TaxID=34254 RepID=A0AAV3QN28_LITER
MTSSIKLDLTTRIVPEPIDHFDDLPDSLLLLIFNRIGDVKALGRCCIVSRRFHLLVPQVDNAVVRVDCVISDDDPSSSSSGGSGFSLSNSGGSDKSRSILRYIVNSLIKPFQSFSQFISNLPHKRGGGGGGLVLDDEDFDQGSVTHHSPTQVLKNFNEIKLLRIELPSGELGIDAGVLLKWRAEFGSTLDNCVILGAASVGHRNPKDEPLPAFNESNGTGNGEGDNGSIPESFYTNGGLKLRVVWTISSLIAASARHYLLQPIIAEHKTLSNLVLTDADGQGVLCMNKEQLEELRVKPLSASSASKRTLVPALNMRLWYAPHLDLPDGTILKGATLVAIRPSEHPKKDVVCGDGNWVASAFEEPYLTAAKMLLKRRTYCLEMNSF